MRVLALKVSIRKESGNLFNDTRIIKNFSFIIAEKTNRKFKKNYGSIIIFKTRKLKLICSQIKTLLRSVSPLL